jgi:hypothetical protein
MILKQADRRCKRLKQAEHIRNRRAVYMLLDLGFQQEARENSKKRNK